LSASNGSLIIANGILLQNDGLPPDGDEWARFRRRRVQRAGRSRHLIVTHEVTNVGSDRSELATVTKEAKTALQTEKLEVVAERGYFNGEEILACEEAAMTVTLPKPMTSGAKSEGRFGKQDFVYCLTRMSSRPRWPESASGALQDRKAANLRKMTVHRHLAEVATPPLRALSHNQYPQPITAARAECRRIGGTAFTGIGITPASTPCSIGQRAET
jgi:hypothetical protein